jgi:hypothetical protein
MSGGSYNYLCHAMRDGNLSQYEGEMQRMAARLRELGHPEAADGTDIVLSVLDAAERAAMALEDVWHAVEWLDSNDSDEEAVAEAVEAYREKRQRP